MAADDELVASVDVPATESRDDDMEAVASETAEQQPAVSVNESKQTTAELEEEASKKGYGRAYAAFGGGKEGLEACAASKLLRLVSLLGWKRDLQPVQLHRLHKVSIAGTCRVKCDSCEHCLCVVLLR